MNALGFSFELEARDGMARCGQLVTPHGRVETPAFMSVATFGAVRGVAAHDLAQLGAQILLANTYHLHERPGEAVVESLGGLHGFTGWRGPWLTDSGGFQVTSLADRVSVDEAGVTFSSPLDGARRLLTPENVIAIQEALGSDIAMVLDECLRPVVDGDPEQNREAVESALGSALDRTLRWAERSVKARKRAQQAVFGIVQGGVSVPRRRLSARLTGSLGFDGYAHGGLGLGESPEQRRDAIACAHSELDEAAPRYLMGLGKPLDIVDAVACGVDLFDCVVPTRNGRHGLLYTSEGVLTVRNARFKDDPRPPDPSCACPTCSRYSRAYLRHLLHSGEALGSRLATLHNLSFYFRLMEDTRQSIEAGTFATFKREVEVLANCRAD
jgi:queuine tRNA-ribosyltransferase